MNWFYNLGFLLKILMSSGKNIIIHSGIVKKIQKGIILVNFISESACSKCHVKGVCSLSDSKEKILEINDSSGSFFVGENVKIILKESSGFKAVLFGYLFPFIIVFLTLIIIMGLTKNELIAGGFSLLFLAPYYFIIFLMKKKLKKTLKFTLEKIS